MPRPATFTRGVGLPHQVQSPVPLVRGRNLRIRRPETSSSSFGSGHPRRDLEPAVCRTCGRDQRSRYFNPLRSAFRRKGAPHNELKPLPPQRGRCTVVGRTTRSRRGRARPRRPNRHRSNHATTPSFHGVVHPLPNNRATSNGRNTTTTSISSVNRGSPYTAAATDPVMK